VSTEKLAVETAAEHRALEKTAIRASFWTILEYGSGMGLRVVSSLVLTRLLLPAYFGEMTLLTTLIVGISLLSDIGLAPSVTQSPRGDDPVFLNTAWTIQVIRGVVLWLVAIAISWPMAKFYHDPQLVWLLPVLSACTMLNGFNSTNLLSLSRHMEVKRLFLIDGAMSVTSLIVTIVWAYYWPSVWSIVWGQVIGTIVRLIISHIPSLTPGIRNSFHWDNDSVHSIVHLGKWILVATGFFFFASQADRLVLGKLVSLSLLGIYGIAYSLSDIPRAVILSLGGRVAYPFIAKMIHRPMDEFRPQFLRYRSYALLAGAFLLSIMATWGGLLIVHLYDARYREAAWIIPILALGLWQTLLYQTTYPALLSLGKAKYNAFGNVGWCIAMYTCIPIAFRFYGFHGAVIAIAAGDLPLYISMQIGATREGIRPVPQDLKLTGIFVAMLLICFFIKRSLS
jgi:O-antigen/teichoic acid export membrane protein